MTCRALIIGIGNEFRRDDGVGLAVATAIAARRVRGVCVMRANGDPAAILDAWAGIPLAIVIDAAAGEGATPGRIRRWTPSDPIQATAVSSHALGLPQTFALGQAVGQIPERLVVFTVDIDDVGHGATLTPAVAAAVPVAVDAVLLALGEAHPFVVF